MIRWLSLFALLLPLTAIARKPTAQEVFDVGTVFHNRVVVGRIAAVAPADAGDVTGYYAVTVDTADGPVQVSSRDPAFAQRYAAGTTEFVFLIDDYVTPGGSHRRVLSGASENVVFERGTIASIDAVAVRERVSRLSRDYLASLRCEPAVQRTLERLAGSGQQSIIDDLYHHRPLTGSQLRCVLALLDSDLPVRVGAFRPPWPARESVYHHDSARLGPLVRRIAPHIIGVPMPPDDALPASTLADAWGYWTFVMNDRR